ncbi:MAG: OmpA family protein [Holophagales bacterium]|jgi:outer membrane protein OmpA-like peptidoglycan-associated protein|nr:OmpA family protein [Holophagales bacterium]MBK9966586.1 OmpA family protein [Holophagales bacterium]
MTKQNRMGLVGVTVLVAGAFGCATSTQVDEKIAAATAKTDQKIETVETQVEDLQTKQKATEAKLDTQGQEIAKLSQSAQEALKRAQEAGILAKGKVVFEQTFSEDRIKFRSGSADLNDDARTALDEFAAKVKELKRPVWMEIQGHTDSTGTAEINDALGEKRAEAVRRYLARKHQLPIQRMATISYGDTLPADPGKGNKARAANRRVVLVVLE